MRPHPTLSPVAATKLIKSYCDQANTVIARHLFDQLPQRDVVAWTAMISGYTSNGHHNDAWSTFRNMVSSTIAPNGFTLSSALTACEGLNCRTAGTTVHSLAIRLGLDQQPYVGNALLHVYASCGDDMSDAQHVFETMVVQSPVSWTTIIAGYTHKGDNCTAIQMFRRMLQNGAAMSAFTSSIAVRASASIGSVELGQQIHTAAVKSGLDESIPVANSLINMYCRCMCLSEAKQLFGAMICRDVITWNVMIAGLGWLLPHESLQLLVDMPWQDVEPNCFTYTSIVSACGALAVLNCGQQVHCVVIQRGCIENIELANALIDMYGKCGCVAGSERIFAEMTKHNLVSWTSVMVGYGINGYGREAVELFDEMICSAVKPDLVVFMGVLSACSHAGLVEQGLNYFNLMTTQYNVVPDKEVYGCVIDLLGRAGRVVEAYELMRAMPYEADEAIWGALFGACRVHCNRDLGRLAARKILDMEPNGAKTFVMLSNIFAANSEWEEFARTRKFLRGMGSKKEAGRSWIEVRDEVCSFVIGDRSNAQDDLIYDVLGLLAQHMDEAKFVSIFDELLHDLENR